MSKLLILKLKAEAANCRRIADSDYGSMKQVLLDRATEIDKQIEELKEHTSQD